MNEIVAKSQSDRSLTLKRGIRILELFSPETSVITTTEAANAIGISRAAARRLLLTLNDTGYLSQEKGAFRLTEKIMSIGQGSFAREERWTKATGIVVDISNRMEEPFSISVLDGPRIRFVARDIKRRIHSAKLVVGDTLPAHCSAAGKILLSALSSEDLKALFDANSPLKKWTPHTLTELEDLEAELKQVCLKSWAVAEDEIEMGTIGIAVPIFDKHGVVCAALAVGSHKNRRSVEELKTNFLPVLLEVASRIGAELENFSTSP
jgi:IclR family pca regulon transcriptional regulator